MIAGLVLLAVVATVSVFLPVWIAFRKPVLRRLAIRQAARRPRETLLVLLGSLLGTAIITSSFVVGDTLNSSIRRSAVSQLGPVDELVLTTEANALDEQIRSIRRIGSTDIDGVLPMTVVTTAVATTNRARKAIPRAQLIEVDFDRARSFGRDARSTGISGSTPRPGHTVLATDLAKELDVEAGETVAVFAYGVRRVLEVDRVLPRVGIAGLKKLSGFSGSESPNLFVAPGTIAGLVSSPNSHQKAAPPIGVIAVSNHGGVFEGADLSSSVTRQLQETLGESPASVLPVKADLLEAAETGGAQFTELFGSIGAFSVLAGILLLVNIFVMLAQERKAEHGMMRAVGLRRSGLVGGFFFEGWVYALASSLLGMVVGLGVGRVVIVVAAGIFAQGGEFSIELAYTAKLASVLTAFLIGFVISTFTVFITAILSSRLNIIRAIRDLPEPAQQHQSVLKLVVAALAILGGGAMFAGGASSDDPFTLVIGPAVVALGIVPLLRRWVSGRLLVSVVALLLLAWAAILSFRIFPDAFIDTDIPFFVVQGVILIAAAVAIVTQNQDAIGAAIRKLRGSSSMALRLGLAYPLARRFRTGMILTMYSLVIFTLTFITVLSNLFANQVDDFTAEAGQGYDIQVPSNATNPVPLKELKQQKGVDGVVGMAEMDADFKAISGTEFKSWPVTGVSNPLATTFERRASRFKTDEEVMRHIVANPDAIAVDAFFLEEGGGGPPRAAVDVGDTVIMRDPLSGRQRRLEVVGVTEVAFGRFRTLVSREAFDGLFEERATTNLAYVSVEDGVDSEATANEINGKFLANGADARSFRDLVSESLGIQTQFFNLMRGYLAIGLLVGIAGLGVVMVRAVRERRRQIGVLRSLGFESRSVRRAFVAESAFVSLEGIVVGASLAMVTAWRLIDADTFGEDLPFLIPWGQIALLTIGTFVASLLATATPAAQASRIRPAVALRISD